MAAGTMHHEVLLALSGYPGNSFRNSKDSDIIEVMEVDPTLPYIHPSEVSLLNRICKLGTHYNRLKKFIAGQNAAIFSLPLPTPTATATTTTTTTTTTNNTKSGLYLKALSCGIDRLLTNYRQVLIDLEQKYMSEPHLPLSHLQSELEEFQLLLPALESCVNHVTSSGRYQGCQVLSYLYEQCSSGIPIIKSSFERILCVCHGVLYKQLSSWMLHGLLMEVTGEFFIEAQHKKEKGGVEGERTAGPLLDKQVSKFTINHSLAPSYLPVRVLDKILFVGEAVTIFQTQNSSTKEKTGGTLFPTLTGAGSKFRSDQVRFGRMLTQLQKQGVFQLHEFEKVIDSIRDCVAELLWKLLVEESDLAGHLKVMKDFFLLGRGELFLSFIDLSHHFMHLPPSATTQHDVTTAFQQAMIRVGMNSEQLSKEFQLVVPYNKQKGGSNIGPLDSSRPQGTWSQLTLSHSMKWPLPILFTPAILTKYNTLFQMLLTIRRTQVGLQQSWALLMQHRRRLEELRQVWELRTHMGFLIDNLQYYVQVDVLETQFSELLERVGETHDYESIKHSHEKYLTTLQSQLFITQPRISHCLHEILSLCNSFSSLLQMSNELSLASKERDEINCISRDFGRHASLFFDIVSGAKSHGSAPHLAQLLLRVDYNKYFSTIKRIASLTATTASMHYST